MPPPSSPSPFDSPSSFLAFPDASFRTSALDQVEEEESFPSQNRVGNSSGGLKTSDSGVKHRRKKKGVKNTGAPISLVLGKDLSIPEALDMDNLAVVGKARGRHFGLQNLKNWAEASWNRSISSLPKISTLSKGWILFKFLKSGGCRMGFEKTLEYRLYSFPLEKMDPSFLCKQGES
jgi:hypothetical protein